MSRSRLPFTPCGLVWPQSPSRSRVWSVIVYSLELGTAGCLHRCFSSLRRRVLHGRCDAPFQTQMVAVAFPTITRSVNEGADDSDAEPTNLASFCRSIQIGAGMGERIEGWPVVDEINRQQAVLPAERNGDTPRRKLHPVAVFNDVGEQLFEDDEKARPFVTGEATIVTERLGK